MAKTKNNIEVFSNEMNPFNIEHLLKVRVFLDYKALLFFCNKILKYLNHFVNLFGYLIIRLQYVSVMKVLDFLFLSYDLVVFCIGEIGKKKKSVTSLQWKLVSLSL